MSKTQDSVEKKEVETRDDFAGELRTLQTEIGKVRAEFGAILEAITKAKEGKEQAKRDYGNCFEAGDQEAMTTCLGTIRKSNDAISRLEADLPAFLSRVGDLRNRQIKLVRGAQTEKIKAETALQEGQRNLQAANARASQALGLLRDLNNLDSFVRGEPERSL